MAGNGSVQEVVGHIADVAEFDWDTVAGRH